MRIDQLVNSYAEHDAVSNHIRLLRELILKQGHTSEVFCEQNLSKLEHIKWLAEFDLVDSPNNTVIHHHSIGTSIPKKLGTIKAKKIVIYHNVTPAKYFTGDFSEPAFYEACSEGVRQLSLIRLFADEVWTVSEYNKSELEAAGFKNVKFMPILRDFSNLARCAEDMALKQKLQNKKNLVFVGRITPHKNQRDLVHLFSELKKEIQTPLRLLLVGGNLPTYREAITADIKKLGLKLSNDLSEIDNCEVFMGGGLSDEQLGTIYKNSMAFVSLSEHEGFGVPLVEAMACGLPVYGLSRAAVDETIGSTGHTFENRGLLKKHILQILRESEDLNCSMPARHEYSNSASAYLPFLQSI